MSAIPPNHFTYTKWRHGGWYVQEVAYPNGAIGCVSRNYLDGKWRIVCDERDGDITYPSRHAAARGEFALAAMAHASPPASTVAADVDLVPAQSAWMQRSVLV